MAFEQGERLAPLAVTPLPPIHEHTRNDTHAPRALE